MNKGLEALKELRKINENSQFVHQRFCNSHLDTIETELKALKIIKEKEVNVIDFIYACKCSQKDLKEWHNCDSNYELACNCVGYEKEQLTPEEYELLKEVLL